MPASCTLRPEAAADARAIEAATRAAFAQAPHSSHTEHLIVGALRAVGQLAVSLVAECGGEVVGHVAVSLVTVDGRDVGWYGLGPISVLPRCQGQGLGGHLMRAALDSLRARQARGCVLLGEPAYYQRFGFRADPRLVLPGVPPDYFMALAMQDGAVPTGTVAYSAAFNATG
ncbi:MAG: N-acetyltransferase [Ottowia sp.]|jgi:putative acetyltransferase|nr:N-acetyltransferase [Ottowia sp.]MBK6748247.1 N-acetyltransferase [Ottowia sp.]